MLVKIFCESSLGYNGVGMAQDTIAIMDKLDSLLFQVVRNFPWDLFPWAEQLSLADQRAFVLEMLEAVRRRDEGQIAACLEDWKATAEALKNPVLMDVVRKPYDPGDYLPWEHVRGEFGLSSSSEEGSG